MNIFEWLFWIPVSLIIYHMVVHPIFLVCMSYWLDSRTQRQNLNKPSDTTEQLVTKKYTVDIVMPVYNEASCLEQKLRNLIALDYPADRMQIHIGLDGCTDQSQAIIEKFLASSEAGNYVIHCNDYPHNRGKIAVLNDLMQGVSSEIILLTDVSALLPADSMEKIQKQFCNKDIGAVSAGYRLINAGQEGESSYWAYQTRIKTAESKLGSVLGAHGSCYAFRRQLYQPLPANTINDDFIIPMRIIRQGYRVIYDTDVIALESEGSSTEQDFKRRKRLSLGNFQQIVSCADLLFPRYGWVAFNFFAGKVLRAIIPLLLLIMLASSAILASVNLFYLFSFVTQVLIYCTVSIAIYSQLKLENTYLYLIFYIVSGYIAGLIGSINFILGKATHSWKNKEPIMNTSFIHPVTSILKRCIDLIGALTGLLLTAPVIPVLAVLIKLTSPGPVIYKQRRVGLVTKEHMQVFEMYKFRSMRNDAEKTTGAVWATENDPRLTLIGRFMRKTRLDEIPQFMNVLKGDMSLIGPRPERPSIADDLENEIPFYLERTFGIIPGITGLAQVYQGYDQTLDDVRNKLNYDLAYSLSLARPMDWIRMECRIIFKTIWVMVTGRGQ